MSTTEKGDAFRELVVSMLEAAGFVAEPETRTDFKKTDARWRREDLDGQVRYLVETKDYEGTLPKAECTEFVTEYGTLLENKHADRAWLISKGPVSPDGRALVDAKANCRCMTFVEFQRRLLGIDGYLQEAVSAYESQGIGEWDIRPHMADGSDLEAVVREWVDEPDALPLAIVAGYGKGKSTFARKLAASMGKEALEDASKRAPVLVPLGDIVDEQSLEGLLGKVFTSRPGVRGYNFGLFQKLNAAGRFLVIFDGFDEMKHGMTLSRFEALIVELMRLDEGRSKIMILGRDTAFQDDYEFKSIIMGRQITSGGQEVQARGRRAFRELGVRDFTAAEAKQFVRKFFPIVARAAARGSGKPADGQWIRARTDELLGGALDELLVRPVHAQMLCEIATDATLSLTNLSTYRLFDLFVHFLLDREVKKQGRDDRFTLEVRRQFNGALALWLWQQGGASTMTLASVPAHLCRAACEGVDHDYDDTALRKELTAGCLIEKGTSGTIFFGHRSLQEFLVAEQMIDADMFRPGKDDPSAVLANLAVVTPEVTEFIVQAAKQGPAIRKLVIGWFDVLRGVRRRDVPRSGIRLFVELGTSLGYEPDWRAEPWFAWLRYFSANRAVLFAMSTPAASRTLSDMVGGLRRGLSEETTHGLFLLVAEVAAREETTARALPEIPMSILLRAMFDGTTVAEAVSKAKQQKRGQAHHVSHERDFRLWAVLHSSSVTPSPPLRFAIDLTELRKRAATGIAMGFSDVEEPAGVSDATMEVQQVYRWIDWSARETETIRPFFSDQEVRDKIRPLEVVKIPPRVTKPAPSPSASRPVLGLKTKD
jgi:hypothetical protein